MHKDAYIFVHNNACETPYIHIYIDLLSINFNLLSLLMFCLMFTIRSVIFKFILHEQQYNS